MVINADQDQFACQSNIDPGIYIYYSEHSFCDLMKQMSLFALLQ